MKINTEIIKDVLWKHTDISEHGINRLIKRMEEAQDISDNEFMNFMDRVM